MSQPALLLIDVQQGLKDPYWGERNNLDAEEKMAELLGLFRERGLPVFHVKHNSTNPKSPLRPGTPGNEIVEKVAPVAGEEVFEKTVNSAFIGTDLEKCLKERGLNRLVVVGLTTDHCVSTSVRMAGNLGFDVTLVEDAVATFDRTDRKGRHFSADQMHQIHLASLDGEFCHVVDIASVAKEISGF